MLKRAPPTCSKPPSPPPSTASPPPTHAAGSTIAVTRFQTNAKIALIARSIARNRRREIAGLPVRPLVRLSIGQLLAYGAFQGRNRPHVVVNAQGNPIAV